MALASRPRKRNVTPDTRPLWRRVRALLRHIRSGLHPNRAADLAGVPRDLIPALDHLIRRAEAIHQQATLAAINAAGADTIRYEYGWAPTQSNVEAATLAGADGRAPVRMRAMPMKGDWKALAFGLERRYPQEWGAQAAPATATAVIEVLTAIAGLRERERPQTLRDLVHRPALPAATVPAVEAEAEADVPAQAPPPPPPEPQPPPEKGTPARPRTRPPGGTAWGGGGVGGNGTTSRL